MKNRKSCILGIIQASVVLCVIAVLLLLVMGNALRREGSLKSWLNKDAPAQTADGLVIGSDDHDVWQLLSGAPAAKAIAPVPLPTDTPLPSPTPTLDVVFAVEATNTVTPTSAPPVESPTSPSIAEPVAATTPLPQPVSGLSLPEQQATRLVIPSLSLDVPVLFAPIEGDTWQIEHLDQAAGHLQGTASPGDANNVVLAGHVTLPPDGRSGPFIGLGRLSAGDTVVVYHEATAFTYVVDRMDTVKPSDVYVTHPTTDARLTLITCLNYDRASGRYSDRLVVVGHLVN